MTIKSFLVRAVAFAICSQAVSPSWGADLPARMAPPVVTPAPLFTWTGLYLGVQAGYAFGRNTLSAPPAFPPFTYARDGVIGGGHAGYNYQVNAIVVGIEGDIEGSSASGRIHNPFNATTVGSQIPLQGSLRGRVGYAIDRLLLFATGGAAFASVRNSYSGFVRPGLLHTNVISRSRVGWTVGGGAEYALTDAWSLRAEYRYSDFGSYASFPGGVFVPRLNRITDQSAEAGVSYRFTTAAPVVARY